MKKWATYVGVGIGVLVLFCLTLSPYLTNGFWGDDCLNSSMAGLTARTGQSVWDFAWYINGKWMREAGRFLPLSWLVAYYSLPPSHFRTGVCHLPLPVEGLHRCAIALPAVCGR
jgi:hypothetical protein